MILNTARYRPAGSGTSTSAIGFGGNTPPNNYTGATETWNGTSWTEVNDLNTAREAAAASGTSTANLAFGGYNPSTWVANTETWNGTKLD